ncbi:HutD family protein [Providencia vermicola]|uniref:HutD/Ves family protein n=1 Tax=Providencia TaxID=586 RepID=UPI0012B60BD3|nr:MULTISPECIES: HutD family protein [Providencia]ELZ5939646.1 HutD family protein [Providencia stuartii]MCK1144808.1 HutD family protein [Providencia stuartii]MTB39795.1 HutD family protein [Providencia sp. wls1949]MTC08334.1 HutD family protein [Providencia sp. wls1948]QIC17344.1 HutD family protein [Providencia vermicola]
MTRVLSAENYQKMPWKNGQGFTLEIARSHGVGLTDFDWRVSIADVKTAGAFSHFPNRKRIIGVLDGGSGLALHIDQKAAVTLRQKQFFAFHGESDVYAELLDETIRDFNLIYNPEKYAAHLHWFHTQQSPVPWISDAERVLIFNIADQLNVTVDGKSYALNAFETLLVENEGNSLAYIAASLSEYDFCLIELFSKS